MKAWRKILRWWLMANIKLLHAQILVLWRKYKRSVR